MCYTYLMTRKLLIHAPQAKCFSERNEPGLISLNYGRCKNLARLGLGAGFRLLKKPRPLSHGGFTKTVLALEAVTSYSIILVSRVNAAGGSGGGSQDIIIPSPFSGTIIDVLDKIIGFLVAIAVPITVIMILIGAFQMLTSGGNAETFRKGTKTVMFAVIGLAVVLLGRGVITLVRELITGNTGSGVG